MVGLLREIKRRLLFVVHLVNGGAGVDQHLAGRLLALSGRVK